MTMHGQNHIKYSNSIRPIPSAFFYTSFPPKALYTPFSCTVLDKSPAHLVLRDLINRIFDEEHKSWTFSSCSFGFLSPRPSSAQMSSSVIFWSKNLILYSFLSVRDQVCHLYTITTEKQFSSKHIYIYLCKTKREDERFWGEIYQKFSELNLLSFSSRMQFWFVGVFPISEFTKISKTYHQISLFHRAFWFIKFYSHQLMHFLIQLCTSLLSYIKIT
jgi:hypothetical protein